MNITQKYFSWQSSILDSEYKGSIVDKHSGDTGTNREHIVRNFLLKHLPKTVSPEIGGKIIDESGQISNQVDIVIYNNSLPRFGANEKSYYFAEGVIAAIQVKSRLTSGELSSSIKNLNSVKKCILQKTRRIGVGDSKIVIPTGIIAFDIGYSSVSSLIKSLKNRIKNDNFPVDFIFINSKVFIVFNKGTWHLTEDDGTKTKADDGYIVVEESDSCLWRLILELSNKASTDVQFLYDFQNYFMKNNDD